MRRLTVIGLGLVASAFLLSAARAQGETVQELQEAYAKASQDWMKEYRSASKEQRSELMRERPVAKNWFGKFWKVVEADPKSGSALQAASWIVSQRAATGVELDQVIGVLHTHHLESPDVHSVCAALSRVPSKASAKFLHGLEAKNPHDKVKGTACFYLAELTKTQAGMIRMLKTADEKMLASYESFYGRETLDVLKNQDPAKLEKDAEALYEKVMKTPTYAGVKFRRSTLAASAKSNLFELRNLAIGKVAPEIDGEDIDGNPMKLTDYRGKVVVLDFWGDW